MRNNNIQIFENEEFGKVRVIEIGGAPWFVGKDVTTILGYGNGSRDINRHVDAEDRQNYRNGTSEINNRGMTVINESGLYSLVLSSKLPSAKRFKRWVTSDVLPSIKKHGAYITDELLRAVEQNKAYAADLFSRLMNEKDQTESLRGEVKTLTPKARYCDRILLCDGTIPVSIIAGDYGMSATKFNRLLHGIGIQYRLRHTWLLYSKYAGLGYTKSRTYYKHSGTTVVHTYWTQKGRRFIYEMLRGYGILPLMETDCDTAPGGMWN